MPFPSPLNSETRSRRARHRSIIHHVAGIALGAMAVLAFLLYPSHLPLYAHALIGFVIGYCVRRFIDWSLRP